MPSMAPSHTGPAPIAAKKAGSTAVAVSWLQSLKRLVSPTPRTVRLSQDLFSPDSAMGIRRLLSKMRRRLLLCCAIKNHAHFFQCNQAAFHHFIETRE